MPAPAVRGRRPFPPRGRVRSSTGVYTAGILVNTFEGGTNSATVTAAGSGGASGNAFDTVTIGSGATDAFDSTHAAHGTLSCKIATGSSATVFNTWSSSLTSVSIPQVWFRLYLYFTANPGAQHRVLAATAGASNAASVQVTTGGKLVVANASGSAVFTTSTSIPLNAWFRVEGFITGSATAGQVSLNLYTAADGLIPAETFTSAATQNTSGKITDVRYGVSAAVASVGPYWMDDIGISATGPLGPALAFAPGQPSSIVCGQAGILPGTAGTALFTTPPGLSNVTFYNLGSTSAWVGTSTAVTSANGMLCPLVPVNYQAFRGSGPATFYGTTGSTVSTSVATIQYFVVTGF